MNFFSARLIALVLLAGLASFSSRGHALVVLQYHHISDVTPAITSTSPALFKAHMQFLEEQQFEVLAITDLPDLLEQAQQKKTELPDKTVIITFDDGYKSIYETAFPELKKRKWPFTVFVNSKPHDEKNPLYASWKQLREMSRKGATIANHTDSHPHMIRRSANESPQQWQQRQLQEILFAENRIKKEIGQSVKMLAYPFGEYNQALLELLKAEGFYGFGQQSGPVASNSKPQLIPRFPFGGAYGDMQDFATKVYSLPFLRLSAVVHDGSGRALADPELPAGETMPVLELVSPVFQFASNVQCFASGQGAINVKAVGKGGIQVKPGRSLPNGRSRYNCTAHAGGNRFYWYSQLFIRRMDDGRWYAE